MYDYCIEMIKDIEKYVDEHNLKIDLSQDDDVLYDDLYDELCTSEVVEKTYSDKHFQEILNGNDELFDRAFKDLHIICDKDKASPLFRDCVIRTYLLNTSIYSYLTKLRYRERMFNYSLELFQKYVNFNEWTNYEWLNNFDKIEDILYARCFKRQELQEARRCAESANCLPEVIVQLVTNERERRKNL
jgi:hypothetical protein